MDAEIERFSENKVYESIFNIFELELEEISRFVSFTSTNMDVYSNKIHELHLRVCSEIENILKTVVHKHFVPSDDIKILWDTEKSAFLERKSLTTKYEELKTELRNSSQKQVDRLLFGFPDFAFYFKLACENFNLEKKVIRFSGMVSHVTDWKIIQPFEIEKGQNVPTWWTNYNKLKHDKIKHFHLCKLGDLINSLSGLFILMNYLLKYQENNNPTSNRNFALDKLKGFIISEGNFCSFESKYFKASVASQSHIYYMILPTQISEDDFQNLTILDLEKRQINNRFENITEYEGYKIKDFNFKSLEHNEYKLTKHEIKNKNDMFRSVEHSLFYTYLDYVKYTNWNNESYRELKHFGRFIN